jgi:hypothetical protein
VHFLLLQKLLRLHHLPDYILDANLLFHHYYLVGDLLEEYYLILLAL